MAKLTNKRRVFIEEYLRCWNATEAARRAGYKHPNVRGSELVVNSSVQEFIQARIAELAMSANEVLLKLSDQARGDIADFVKIENVSITDEDGAEKHKQVLVFRLPSEKSHLVKNVSQTKNGIRIELYDAQNALVQLAKRYRSFAEKREYDITVVGIDDVLAGLPRILGEAVRRALADALSEKGDKAGS